MPRFNKLVRYKILSLDSRRGTYRTISYIWLIKTIFSILQAEYGDNLLETMLISGEIPIHQELYSKLFEYLTVFYVSQTRRRTKKPLNEDIKEAFLKGIIEEITSNLDRIHDQLEFDKSKKKSQAINQKRGAIMRRIGLRRSSRVQSTIYIHFP